MSSSAPTAAGTASEPPSSLLAPRVACDPQAANGRSAWQRAQLRVSGQVPGEYDSVDVVHRCSSCWWLVVLVAQPKNDADRRAEPEPVRAQGNPPCGG